MEHSGEYFVAFNAAINPGKLEAVRVRIDLVTIVDQKEQLNVGLADHPLYKELQQYVLENPR